MLAWICGNIGATPRFLATIVNLGSQGTASDPNIPTRYETLVYLKNCGIDKH